MKRPFSKIGIVFQPLGINHFIEKPFKEIHPEKDNIQLEFFRKAMESAVKSAFEEKNMDKRAAILEAYFENNLVEFKDQKMLDAIDFILHANLNITVSDVAEEIGVNRKALFRMFKNIWTVTKNIILQ